MRGRCVGISWKLETGALLDRGGYINGNGDILMNIEAYAAIAEAGGLAKPARPPKSPSNGLKRQNHPLKRKTRLGNRFKSIPTEVKKAVLEEKGSLCFCGLCGRCGGTMVSIHEGQHHFPHKGPHCTPDDVKYLWPAHNLCQGWYHEHPKEERELFKRLEAAGYHVYWSIPTKSGG